ncbi:hypothetical protein [Streptomyces sp. R35]|uniref:Chitinase n=1 Tax=Streptomyces sp. R35 TaxID=3238630 RepID=A0AB39SAU4_9ACTN
MPKRFLTAIACSVAALAAAVLLTASAQRTTAPEVRADSSSQVTTFSWGWD